MVYRKPHCECGEELLVLENVMHSIDRRVLKNGEIAKNPIGKPSTEQWSVELYCSSCGNTYGYEIDNESRVVRGNISREGF